MNQTNTRWRDLWAHEKLSVAIKLAHTQGGLAFSLNLSEGREQALWKLNDPVERFAHYLNRELRRLFDRTLPLAFAFELAPRTGRLHLHGVVTNGDTGPDFKKAFKMAVCRAAGAIEGKAGATQFHAKKLFQGAGWAEYTKKSLDQTQSYFGTVKTTYISPSLLSASRARYEGK